MKLISFAISAIAVSAVQLSAQSQISSALKTLKKETSSSQVDTFVSVCDKDHDGFLDLQEAMDCMPDAADKKQIEQYWSLLAGDDGLWSKEEVAMLLDA